VKRRRAVTTAFVLSILVVSFSGLAFAQNDDSSLLDGLVKRFHFDQTDPAMRFRYADKAPHQVTNRDFDYKLTSKVRFDIVGEGRTYLEFRGESGKSFTTSFDNTGVGKSPGYWSFNLKTLTLGQKLGQHYEAQVGSLSFDYGAGTEATYADNDGWFSGYRFRATSFHYRWLPNAASISIGFVGDFSQPNAFARLHRLGDENYIQALALKNFAADKIASVEFDSFQSVCFARLGFDWTKMPVHVFDEMRIEEMTRASDGPTFGFSGQVVRKVDPAGRVNGGFFYSQIPSNLFVLGKTQLLLNGDLYTTGRRLGPIVRVSPFKALEITLVGTERVDRTPSCRYRGDVRVRYQAAPLLNRLLGHKGS
jgi:hypothetical protein